MQRANVGPLRPMLLLASAGLLGYALQIGNGTTFGGAQALVWLTLAILPVGLFMLWRLKARAR